MTKNVVAKTWSGPTDADGWVYSGPPGDVTPPTAPVIAVSNILDTSFVARVSAVSVDSQNGVLYYTPYIAPASTGTYVALTPVSTSEATQGVTITGRIPQTAYLVKFTATDNSPAANESADSNILTVTTSASIPTSSWFPNWPIMSVSTLVAAYTYHIGDSTQRDYAFEKDVIIIQALFYPISTRFTQRIAALSYGKTNYPNCKVIFYTIANECMKVVSTPGNSVQELTKSLIEGSDGKSTWYARRRGGQQTEALHDPANLWQTNGATNDAGLNSKGERFDQAFARMLDEQFNHGISPNYLDLYAAGFYLDNLEALPPQTYINNGATAVTDMDFDQDGVTDVINGYGTGSNQGGRMWSEGSLNFKATYESRFKRMMIPNAARWGVSDYSGSRKLPPPLPLSLHPFYGKWAGLILKEHADTDWGFSVSTTAYTYKGGLNASYAYRWLTVEEKFLGPDSASKAGRSAVIYSGYAVDRIPTSTDITYARFHSAAALLMERCAPSIQASTKRPIPLDELFIYLGPPLRPRSMGTLDETTLGFTLRAANYTSGAAKFHWAEFQNGIVVVRTDSPSVGTWPSADAAVACVLPSAGAGMKWQALNATTYVNPVTGRKCRGQDTTLNNGADLTNSAALKPYHAQFIRRVSA